LTISRSQESKKVNRKNSKKGMNVICGVWRGIDQQITKKIPEVLSLQGLPLN